MTEIASPPKVVVAGTSGTGKSTLLRERILPTLRPRVTVWDPVGQYPADVSYRPRDMTSTKEAELFLERHSAIQGPWTVVLGEVESIYYTERLPRRAARYVLTDRNFGKGWVVDVRRPQGTSKAFFDEARDLFLFKLNGLALERVMDYLGKEMRGVLEPQMRALRVEDHAYFHIHDGDVTGPHTFKRAPTSRGARAEA